MTGELFLNHSSNKLTQTAAYIEACLLKLDSDQIWNRSNEVQNSIGNLVLHLSGNVRQWIGWSVGGQPDIRQREREFAATSRVDTAELLSILDTTIINALSILKNLPPHRLNEIVFTQDGQQSVLEVIYQVVGHFQQHAGQIFFETKRLTGEDLKFYTPPKESS